MCKQISLLLFTLFTVYSILLPVSFAYAEDAGIEQWGKEQIVRGKVIEVNNVSESDFIAETNDINQLIKVKITNSKFKDKIIEVPHVVMEQPGYNIELKAGDGVILYIQPNGNDIEKAYITDHARDKPLLYMTVLFILLLLVVGGFSGLKSIISLAITIGAVLFVLIPLIFQGYPPILTTVLVSSAIAAVTIIMIGGFSVKTIAAIVGTTGGVLVAGVLAYIAGTAAYLTGFSDEEMHMLLFIPQEIDFNIQGILFSGMIIGALGAVMDVGMSIASAMEEIRRVNPFVRARSLFYAGMNIGRDIMGTMANTLILAYAGGSIPLILVFIAYDTPLLKVINLEFIATEVIRALSGSIGLILTIPITSITVALLFKSLSNKPRQSKGL